MDQSLNMKIAKPVMVMGMIMVSMYQLKDTFFKKSLFNHKYSCNLIINFIQGGEPRFDLLVSTSWHSGVAPCMHGALSTQKLELHAIQLWGCAAQNKELSGFCFEQVAPGPAVFGGTQIR